VCAYVCVIRRSTSCNAPVRVSSPGIQPCVSMLCLFVIDAQLCFPLLFIWHCIEIEDMCVSVCVCVCVCMCV
jgi:hypothetical protein